MVCPEKSWGKTKLLLLKPSGMCAPETLWDAKPAFSGIDFKQVAPLQILRRPGSGNRRKPVNQAMPPNPKRKKRPQRLPAIWQAQPPSPARSARCRTSSSLTACGPRPGPREAFRKTSFLWAGSQPYLSDPSYPSKPKALGFDWVTQPCSTGSNLNVWGSKNYPFFSAHFPPISAHFPPISAHFVRAQIGRNWSEKQNS